MRAHLPEQGRPAGALTPARPLRPSGESAGRRLRGGFEPLVVAAFALGVLVPFWGKPYHMDEPFFLAIARHVLRDPRHPLSFAFNWYGTAAPMASINNTPPLLGYALALAWRLTGGAEWLMRLALCPLDVAAALGVYGVAARFLRKPLLPTLVVVAGPAWMINLNHLMAEKLMAAFAFPALYALVRGVEDEDRRWYWGSAVLAALAIFSKYNAAFLLAPATLYAWGRLRDRRPILAYWVIALAPAALYVLSTGALSVALGTTGEASRQFWHSWAHEKRSLLAFIGGCAVAATPWPWFIWDRRAGLRAAAVVLTAATVLFLPAFDLAPLVRAVDRVTGLLLAAGALASVAALLGDRRRRGWALWSSWLLGVTLLQLAYWSIMTRFILFLTPPLILGLAERLEDARDSSRALYLGSLAATLALSTALSLVDLTYARAQKELAQWTLESYPGRKLWCVPHWGLQQYLEAAGAEEMDFKHGGWSRVKAGDVVVLSKVNSNVQPPAKPLRALARLIPVDQPIPLRLISGWTGEGGFYANVTGFLPYSLSREPLELFTVLEIQ